MNKLKFQYSILQSRKKYEAAKMKLLIHNKQEIYFFKFKG